MATFQSFICLFSVTIDRIATEGKQNTFLNFKFVFLNFSYFKDQILFFSFKKVIEHWNHSPVFLIFSFKFLFTPFVNKLFLSKTMSDFHFIIVFYILELHFRISLYNCNEEYDNHFLC